MFDEMYTIKYELDGNSYETREMYNRRQANIEKAILEEDGAKNVRLVKVRSALV